MKPNLGTADRAIRITIGVALLVGGFIFSSPWGALGVIPLFTGAMRWCPLYVPFNLSTVGRANKAGRAAVSGKVF